MGKPVFEIEIDSAGEYRFCLKSANGEIIADSEGYKTLQGCKKGIASVQANAARAVIVFENEEQELVEVTKKQLNKELIKIERNYNNPNLPDIVKSEEEKEDEKKVFIDDKGPFKNGPTWL